MGQIATKAWIYSNKKAISGWNGDNQCPTKSVITSNGLLVNGSYSTNQLVQQSDIDLDNNYITLYVTADVDTYPYVIKAAVNTGLVNGAELARVFSNHIVDSPFSIPVSQNSATLSGFYITNLSGTSISGYDFNPTTINWTKGSDYDLTISTVGFLLALNYVSGTGSVRVVSDGFNTTLSVNTPTASGHVTGNKITFTAQNQGYIAITGIQSGYTYAWSVTSTSVFIDNIEANDDAGLEIEWHNAPF